MENVLEGYVRSGGTRFVMSLYGVPVTLHQTTSGAPKVLGGAQTGDRGRFAFSYSGAGADGIFYATAQVAENVTLMAVIGPEIKGEIVINELTTVAAAFSMAQFADGTALSGNAFGLSLAAMMNHNLADVYTGEPSPVLLSPPNADQTNALRSTRSLANLVAACFREQPGIQARFFQLTRPPGGTEPGNAFQALLNIARYPANNAELLYDQSAGVPTIYSPPLFNRPDAWTLAVKVNDSGWRGSDPEHGDYMFGGPANIAFDRNGYAWIGNNVFQGTPNSGNFIVVLQPDGKPAQGGAGLPVSPVFGGGLIGPGWGVTIDPDQDVWVGNYGWGDPDTQYPVDGTVSKFGPDGAAISGSGGYGGGGLNRAQAVVSDRHGNIWIASYGDGTSGSVVVFPGGNAGSAQSLPAGNGTFGVAITRDDEVWVSDGGGGLGWPRANPGGVSRFRLDPAGPTLKQLGTRVQVGAANKAIAVDSQGNAWLASGGDNTVYLFDSAGNQAGAFSGVGGMDAPWGICVDGEDHVWVGNFGVLGPESDYTYPGLTRLVGANPATCPPGMSTGDPLSPATGYTLPSAGEEVLLHNGDPVYKDGTECYSPFMRCTSCQIDQAGNVWAVNNWKPRFRTAFEPNEGNPGGDGVVIFVGLARPPALPSWIVPAE